MLSTTRLFLQIVLALWLSAISGASARDIKINLDVNGGGFAIQGWSRQVAHTGTIFYYCQQAACGRGSVVSMAQQRSTQTVDMLAHRERLAAAYVKSSNPGKILRVDTGQIRTSQDKLFKAAEVTRTITPIGGSNIGMDLFWMTGFVSSSSGDYTLSSSAKTRKHADTNYATFKSGVFVMTGIRQGKNNDRGVKRPMGD